MVASAACRDAAVASICPNPKDVSRAQAAAVAAREIAFIDPAVSDVHVLLAGLRPDVQPILLNAAEPAPRQMAAALRGRAGLDAIHIIAHGAPGEVRFAAGALSADSLDEHAVDLSALGARLGRNARLMLWTCETGQGERGQDFVAALASASGTRVGASTRLVGAAARGGCWDLDTACTAALVRAPLTATGAAAYAGVIAPVPVPTPRTWIGAGGTTVTPADGAWSIAANWSPPGVPLAIDPLTIGNLTQANAFTLTVDTAAVALSIAMNGSAASSRFTTLTLTAGNSLATSGAITFNGTAATNVINGAGTLNAVGGITGIGTLLAGTATSGGTLDVSGPIASGVVLSIGTAAPSDLTIEGVATSAATIAINNSNQTLEIGPVGNLIINGNEFITNGTIKLDGGTLADTTGSTEDTFTVGSGGTLTGFGAAPNDITLAGGTISQSGGVLKTLTITGVGTVNDVTGAFEIAAAGGILDLTGTVSNALLVADPNKGGSVLKVDGNVTAGDTGFIDINNANQTVEIGAAGTLTLPFFETMTNGTIKLDGGTLNATDGMIVGNGAKVIGQGVVNGAISGNGGVVEGTGGILNISNVTSSTILLEADSAASSVLALDGTVASGISFDYLNTNGILSGGLLLGTGTAQTSFETGGTIFGMQVGSSATAPTDFIDLAGVAPVGFTSGVIAGSTMELFNGTTLVDHFKLASAPNAGTFVDWTADASTGTDVFLSNVVCYAAGTHILTATGERMVESLMQGDIVLTLAGGELVAQPVKWLGQRRIDLTAHPHPETVAPIRIRRGAFADNMPHRDLLLSPDHAVFVDGRLICARQLVNGSTIRQQNGGASVEYFHVELDAHAILVAEGLPAESYLNTGNRGFFANSGEPLVLHPDLTDETDYPTRAASSCAPFVSDEASVLPVWQRLAARAAALGQPAPELETTGDPELRIVAKGRTVRPLYGENGLYIFALPKGATEVRLLSRSGAPTDARPWLDDRRRLGVNVERIVLRGASEMQEVPVDHPRLSQGWQAPERDGAALRRWTSGDAVLPLPTLSGPTMLEIRIGSGGMAYVTTAEQERRVA
jgi:Hint domain/Domain of unknown function (DUF4347)